MKKVVINEGIVQVKKDGVLYEMKPSQFSKIKAVLFDYDTPLCKYCANMCSKCKNNDHIKDALAIKDNPECVYVFACTDFVHRYSIEHQPHAYVFYEVDEKKSDERLDKEKYTEAINGHIAHPRVYKFGRFEK